MTDALAAAHHQPRRNEPRRTQPGAKLRLNGKGHEGMVGRNGGDLYLLLEPVQVPGYLRDGANLRGTLEISCDHAEAGGPVSVPTPWGTVRLDVPPATRTGMRFRLQGQGLPQWRRETRGDLFLKIAVR